MKRTLRTIPALLAAVFALPAGAVTWTWDLHDTANSTPSCSTSQLCTIALPGSPNDLKLYAYSNSAWSNNAAGPVGMGTRRVDPNSSTNTAMTNSTGWVAAENVLYGTNGFGIKNTVQALNSEEDVAPQHAVDNKEVLDIMVIEMPDIKAGQAWDFQNLILGWAQTNGTGNSAQVSVFVGGTELAAGYDFTGVCFDSTIVNGAATDTNCRAGEKKLSTLGGGFTNITSQINSGNALTQNTAYNVSGTNAGNYVVITGRLGDYDDAFKLKGFTATSVTTKVPEPATVALLGLGLFGLVASRRRRAARA